MSDQGASNSNVFLYFKLLWYSNLIDPLDERLLYAARTDDEDTLVDILSKPDSFEINFTDGSASYKQSRYFR
jgi:hypothetical protein